MNLDLLFPNLARYLAQSTVLVAVAGLSIYLLRIRAPKARLAIWHVVLAACVCLPFVQSLQQPAVAEVAQGTGIGITVTYGTPFATAGFPFTLVEVLTALLLAGAVVRWLRLTMGFLRLRRRLRQSTRIDPAREPFPAIEAALGVRAEYYTHESVKTPVTFGLRRPVVLLPGSFFELPPESSESVIWHELLHVKRRDWLFTIAEEVIRGLLWFHPAVWWLLSRIQVTREQVVDEAVVKITREQDRYLSALLEMAAVRLEPDLAPAPLFLRRHHLTERVAFLIQGGHMSRRHLYVSMLAVFALLPLAAGLVIWTWPLQAAAQAAPQDSPGVEVNAGPFKLLHRTGIAYPPAAMDSGVSGDVVVDIRTNAKGDVVDATVVSGPDALRSAVLKSVLNWHFDPAANLPPHFEIGVRFAAPAVRGPQSAAANAGTIARQERLNEFMLANGAKLTLRSVNLQSLPPDLAERVRTKLSLRAGDVLSADELKAAFAGLREIDEHLAVTLRPTADPAKGIDAYVALRQPGTASSLVPQGVDSLPIRVGGNAAATKLIKKVTPIYPQEAKAAGIEGRVQFNATIDKNGTIRNLELLSGDPILAEAAMDAVKQWIYEPTLLNGDPVAVITQIDVNFTLAR